MTRLSLQARQTTGLVMTAQLQQAIGLLQLSNQELLAELTLQAESNPLLVVTPPSADEGHDASGPVPQDEARSSDLPHDLDPDMTDWREAAAWDDDPLLRVGSYDSDDMSAMEPTAPAPTRLEHFIDQIGLAFTHDVDRQIALALLEAMDVSGRLETSLPALAEALRLSPARIDAVRSVMMAFDPPGCFAFSLAECLAAQFKAHNRYDPAVATLLHHLDWLARGDHDRLRKACGLDEQDYAELLQEVRRCDPKPGSGLTEATPEIAPDLFIHLLSDEPIVTLNPATWPGLTLDERLYERLMKADRETRVWAQEKQYAAQTLLHAVEQRARSLLLIGQAIARHQIGFLINGVAALRPLTLAQVAAVTGLHESTVSRVTAKRVIGTPHGVLPLRRFFSTALGDEGEQTSAEAIKAMIRQMIGNETPDMILSDDAVTQQLQRNGIAIQRRTVAKYREALGIAGSAQRRRDIRMKARLTG